MFWEEDEEKSNAIVNRVVDLRFRLEAGIIPLDHAQILGESLLQVLPWLPDEKNCGVHMIHVAASGNGWLRPEDPENEVLCLSNRTRLHLRIPHHRVEDAQQLIGNTILLGDSAIKVGKAQVKPLSDSTTIFARYIVSDNDESESDFMQRQLEALESMDIKVKKMLCGIQNVFKINEQVVHTKSLMLAELTPEESILLQEKGLGPLRLSGFGLFNAHKGIAPVFTKE